MTKPCKPTNYPNGVSIGKCIILGPEVANPFSPNIVYVDSDPYEMTGDEDVIIVNVDADINMIAVEDATRIVDIVAVGGNVTLVPAFGDDIFPDEIDQGNARSFAPQQPDTWVNITPISMGGFNPASDQQITGEWSFSELIAIPLPGPIIEQDENGIFFSVHESPGNDMTVTLGAVPGMRLWGVALFDGGVSEVRYPLLFDHDSKAYFDYDVNFRDDLNVNGQRLKILDKSGESIRDGALHIYRDSPVAPPNGDTFFRKYDNAGQDSWVSLVFKEEDGRLLTHEDPIDDLGIATKRYVDNNLFTNTSLAAYAAAGDISLFAPSNMTLATAGALDIETTFGAISIISGLDLQLTAAVNKDIELITSGTGRVVLSDDPVIPAHAANKAYVDAQSGGGASGPKFNFCRQVGNSFPVTGYSYTITALSGTDIVTFNTGTDAIERYTWDGDDWSLVGTGLSVINFGGVAIVAISDSEIAVFNATTVLKGIQTYEWTGSTWVAKGNLFAIASVDQPSIVAIGSYRIAIFEDNNDELATYEFDSVNWSLVGTPFPIVNGFSTSMAVLDNNRIVFQSESDNSIRVLDFNGSTWAQVGNKKTVSIDFAYIIGINLTDIIIYNTISNNFEFYRFDGADFTLIASIASPDPTDVIGYMAAMSESELVISRGPGLTSVTARFKFGEEPYSLSIL